MSSERLRALLVVRALICTGQVEEPPSAGRGSRLLAGLQCSPEPRLKPFPSPLPHGAWIPPRKSTTCAISRTEYATFIA
jgi:hypothetical protein